MNGTHRFLPLVIVYLVACSGCAPPGSGGSSTSEVEEQVLAAEDAYIAAEVSRDETALRRLVDDRFAFNRSQGTTSGKEELVQSVLSMSMTGQTVRERSVLIEGDVALVFGTADLSFAGSDGTDSISSLRYTATYVKRKDGWRMLALQMQQRASEE